MRIATILTLLTAFALAEAPAAQTTGSCQLGGATSDLDQNQVRARLYNKGNLFYDGGSPVYEVPAGQGVHPMFAAGLWVGGMRADELKIAAATFAQGEEDYEFWPGPLDEDGTLPDPDDCSPYDRIWNVTRSDVEDYDAGGMPTPDLAEWPVGLGAPTCMDENDNARCEPTEAQVEPESREQVIDLEAGELPDLRESAQGAFWVMNDVGNEHLTTLSDPIGLEVRVLAYAYDEAPLQTTTLYDYELVYRGDAPLEEAYFTFFADPDLGYFLDDYIGSAPALDLGFVYNADNNDETSQGGYGTAPPTLGIDFLRGPVLDVDGDGDLDTLGMTRFGYFDNSTDPRTGNPDTDLDFYNYMRGLWKDGTPWTEGGDASDLAGEPVDFIYPNSGSPGSPVPGYWSEVCPQPNCANSLPPDDRRFTMSTGPFTMQPGDVRTVTVGIVWARGSSNYTSLQDMKLLDEQVQAFFDGTLPPVATEDGVPPTGFALAEAFPNPFSERVTLPIRLAEADHATVEVLDVLGRRVGVVLDEVVPVGTREVVWTPEAALPSGVYFVRMQTGGEAVTRAVVLQR